MSTEPGGELAIPPKTDAAPDNGQAPAPVHRSLNDFVNNWFAPTIQRRLTTRSVWCPQWWAHPEAALRLQALWWAWEEFYKEGGAGPSSFWVYHLDHHLMALFDPETGPFCFCRDGHDETAHGLECVAVPAHASPAFFGVEATGPAASPESDRRAG